MLNGKTLGDIGELIRGNGLPKSDFTASGVPAIHYGQIYASSTGFQQKRLLNPCFSWDSKTKIVNDGDVVITNTSENFTDVGAALVYLGKKPAVTGGHATIFKPSNGILGKYFAYFTQTATFANEKRKVCKRNKSNWRISHWHGKNSSSHPLPRQPEKNRWKSKLKLCVF